MEDQPYRRFYLGNLPFDVTEDEIRETVESVAIPTMVSMPRDRETQKFRGFAFATFYMNGKSVEFMIDALVKLKIRGRTIHPELANLPRPVDGRG